MAAQPSRGVQLWCGRGKRNENEGEIANSSQWTSKHDSSWATAVAPWRPCSKMGKKRTPILASSPQALASAEITGCPAHCCRAYDARRAQAAHPGAPKTQWGGSLKNLKTPWVAGLAGGVVSRCDELGCVAGEYRRCAWPSATACGSTYPVLQAASAQESVVLARRSAGGS